MLTRPDEPREGPLDVDRGIDAIWRVFDLTGSLRAAADLARCLHRTVARLVAGQEAGGSCRGCASRASRSMTVTPRPTGVTRWILAGTVRSPWVPSISATEITAGGGVGGFDVARLGRNPEDCQQLPGPEVGSCTSNAGRGEQ